MSKNKIQSLKTIMNSVEKKDPSQKGIPTFIGMFKHPETGLWVDFDVDIAPSGYTRNNIHYNSGLTGNGKTERSLQSAVLQSINGFKVCYITLEQTPFDIMAKMIAKVDGVKAYEWKQMPYGTDEEFEKKKEKGLEIIEAYFENFEGSSMMDIVYGTYSTVEMTNFLKNEIFGKYDIVYVDNFQNCYSRNKGYEDYELMTRETRGNILGTNTALVWLSQIDEKTGRTKNSRALEEDAALGIRIYREKEDDKKNKKDDGSLPTVSQPPTSYLDVEKNREDQIKLKAISFPYDLDKGRIGSFNILNLEEQLRKKGQTQKAEKIEKEKQIQLENEQKKKDEDLIKSIHEQFDELMFD